MLIGLHSYSRRQAFSDQPGYDIHAFLQEAADWGFEAVEVMTGKAGQPPSHVGTDEEPRLQALCEEARELGVPIRCWSTYNDFSFTPNEEWRRANVDYIERWIALAAATGVPNLRFLTGYLPADQELSAMEDLVLRETQRVARVAEAAGVNLALENHSKIFEYADDILRLRDAVGSPRLTTCPDPSNGFTLFTDSPDPAEHEKMLVNLEKLAPFATNAHIKVADAQFRGIDARRVLEILDSNGFQGAIHLELISAEADPSVLADACAYLKKMRLELSETHAKS